MSLGTTFRIWIRSDELAAAVKLSEKEGRLLRDGQLSKILGPSPKKMTRVALHVVRRAKAKRLATKSRGCRVVAPPNGANATPDPGASSRHHHPDSCSPGNPLHGRAKNKASPSSPHPPLSILHHVIIPLPTTLSSRPCRPCRFPPYPDTHWQHNRPEHPTVFSSPEPS